MGEIVRGILRAVSSGLQIPTIIILILLILLAILMLGTFIAEIVTERKTLKLNIPKLVDELQGKTTAQMKDVIAGSTLLMRQKTAIQELISRVSYPDDTREALARQLIADEEARYSKIVKITDLTARVAPMFGLMGTLIPLGPGLIALGEGDAATLSQSMLTAFDTTVAGLISGAISFVISGIRKGWYEEYMIGLETVMETVLDVQNTERRKALQQKKAADAAKAGNTAPEAAPAGASRNTITIPREELTAQTSAAVQQARPAAPSQGTARQAAAQAAAMHPGVRAAQAAAPAAAAAAQTAQTHQAPAQPAHAGQPAQAARAAAQPAQQMARPAMPAQAAPAQPAHAAPAQTEAQRVTAKPTFAQANSKTIAGYDAQQFQTEVRAAEEAMRRTEAAAQAASAEAAVAKEMEQIQSLDDLLESFAPRDGRQ